MKKILTLIFTLLLTAVSWQLSAKQAHAQNLGISVSPTILDVVIKPGKTVSQAFTLQSLSDTDQTLVIRIVPFTPQGNIGLPLLKPNLDPNWLSYFSLANTSNQLAKPFNLPSGQKASLILTISIPNNAPQTDHYATLLITSNNETESSKILTPVSAVNTSIGANILISISNSSAPTTLVKIEKFLPDEKDYLFRYGSYFVADNSQPIHFSAIASNVGKYKTKTSGLIQVTRSKDLISLQSLIPLNLLANSQRLLQGSPSGEILFQPTILDLGVHQVSLDVRSENGSSHSQLTIIILPIKALAGILLGLTLLILILKIQKTKSKTNQREHNSD